MAGDTNTNIFIGIDTTQAMAQLRALEKELTALNRAMITGTSTAAREQARYAQSLMHNVNATGLWTASTMKMSSATEQFADRLDKGKLSLKDYYRYGMASTKTFGKFFGSEFSTVSKLVENRVKTLQQQYVQLGRDANGALNAMKFRPKTLNYNDLTTSLMLATQRHQLLNKLIDDGSTKLLNFGKNTQWAGRQLMVGFTIPLIMFAGQAIKSFKELETQVIRFKKVYGDIYTNSGESTKALKDIRALADEYTAYGVKVADTIKMAADAAAMGNTGENLKNIVKQTTDLAVLGGITQEQALNTTIALQNAFDIRGTELKKTIDFLNATENQTVLSLEDITAAIPRVAPVVKALGGNVQDLTYFLTAMKEGGISAEQGANALKSGLASLINPTNSATKAAKQYGISIKGIVEANEGNLRNTVVGFANALKPLTDLQRAQVIEKVFGKYQFARMSTLLNNLTKDGSQAARVLQLTTASAEELAILTEREKKTQADSAMNKLAQAVERLKVAIAPVGEMFAKMVIPIAEFFQKIFDKFSSLPEGVKKFAGVMVTAIGGIGPILLMTVGLVANGIANILKLFNLMRKGYQQLAYGSQDVALKTQYLSQEELENASITNALYTKHEALSAAYRLEAQTLGSLMNVYRQANTSMGAFAANNSGLFVPRGIAPKRFASGTESVPGPRGAGDIVPAMLSPGEAVIPAKQTKKYGGFISQIISDKVPGFVTGPGFVNLPKTVGSAAFGAGANIIGSKAKPFVEKIDLSTPVRSPRGTISTPASRTPGLGGQAIAAEFPGIRAARAGDTITIFVGDESFRIPATKFKGFRDKLKENEAWMKAQGRTDNTEQELLRTIKRKGLGGTTVTSPSNIYSRLPKFSNARNSQQFQEVADRRLKALMDSRNPHLIKLQNYMQTEEKAYLEQALGKDVVEKLKGWNTNRLTPSHIREVRSQNRTPADWAPSKIARDWSWFNSALRGTTFGNVKGGHPLNAKQANELLFNLRKTPFDKLPAEKQALQTVLEYRLNRKPSYYDEFIFTDNAMMKVKPMKLAEGILSVPGPKGAGDIQPAMLAPGEAVIPAKQSKKYSGLISGIMSNRIPGFEDGPGFGVPASLRPGGKYTDDWGDPIKPTSSSSSNDRVGKAIDRFFDKPRVKKLGDRIDKFAAQMGKTTPKVAQLGVTASQTTKDFGTDKTRGFRGFMAGYSRVPQADETGARLTAAQRTNARQAMRMERSQKMMGVGMASMMVPMVAGAYAAKNPDSGIAKNMDKIMMASMLPMLIPLINSPTKILATSLIGLAAVFKIQSAQIKQSLVDGEKQAKAMTMTTEGLEQLGQYTQKVSIGQVAAAQRESRTKGITPVSMDYGTNFLGSEAGKQFKANFDSTIKTLGASGTAQAASIVATQLATAVQQGVLTSDQAESIAIKLTRDLKDATLEMQVRGKLIELLGPNGENLTLDPLSVQVKLIAEGKTLEKAIFLNLQKAVSDVNQGIGPNMKLNPLKGVGGRRANEQAGGAIAGNPMNWSETAQMQGLAATVGSASFIKILNTVRAARAASAAATAGTAVATGGTGGLAAPGLIAAAGSFAITSTAEWLLRKWQQGEEKKFVAKNAGTLAGIVSQNILAGQQGIDAVTKEYDTALANLEVKKNLAKTEAERALVEEEMLKLQNKKENALITLRANQAAQAKTAADYYNKIGSEEGKNKYLSAYRAQMVNKFKDDPYQKAQAEALSTQLKGTTARAQIEIMTFVNSDQMTVSQAKALTTTLLSTGQKNIDRTINTMLKIQGTEGVGRLASILEFIPGQVNQKNILLSVKDLDPTASNEIYSGLEELINIPPFIGIELNLETQKNDIDQIKRIGREATALKKAIPNGKIDLKVLTDLQQKVGGPGQNLTLDKAIEQWGILSKLPKELQFQAMITLSTLNMSDSVQAMLDRDINAEFLKANPGYKIPLKKAGQANVKFEEWSKTEAGLKAIAQTTQRFYEVKMPEIFGTGLTDSSKKGNGVSTGDGPKRDMSWLNDLAQKLKLVKDSSIDALNPLKSIQKFLGGDIAGQGGGSVDSNKSLDRQLGAIRQIDELAKANNIAGLSDDFREILKSMDPEQFKLWANTLFKVGKGGRITALTQDFIDINSAFKTSTIGSYVEDQIKSTDEMRDRINAYYQLVNEYGVRISDTLDLLKNQSLVADLANGVKYSKEELEALKQINAERTKFSATEKTIAQDQDNAFIFKQIDAFKKLQNAGVEFDTILQIIAKQEWAKAVSESTGDVKQEFSDLINKAAEYKDLLFELRQLQETKSDKMGQQFAAANAKITAKAMADFRKANGMSVEQYKIITQERENARQALQDQIDVLNNGLTVFDKLESSINDSYTEKNKLIDEQISALQKVSQINEEIASQQKDQLDLAGAITSGDISAAAQAAQQYRANRAKAAETSAIDALNIRKDILEKQKLKDIAALTTVINGVTYTRQQLTDKIASIEEGQLKTLSDEITARNRVIEAYDQSIAKAQALVEINGYTEAEYVAIKDAVNATNEALDTQLLNLDDILFAVGGIEAAWIKVAQAAASVGTKTPQQKPDQKPDSSTTVENATTSIATIDTIADNIADTVSSMTERELAKYGGSQVIAEQYLVDKAVSGLGPRYGGMLKGMYGLASGGVVPKYFASGGYAMGTDTVPAMLTPGEFVVKRFAVKKFGVENLKSINDGTYSAGASSISSINNNSNSVYNYGISVNVSNSNASTEDIARAVMTQIRNIDNQRIRGQR